MLAGTSIGKSRSQTTLAAGHHMAGRNRADGAVELPQSPATDSEANVTYDEFTRSPLRFLTTPLTGFRGHLTQDRLGLRPG